MALYQVGITYRSASPDERGELQGGEERLAMLYDQLLAVVTEVLVLVTCGRFEVYVAAPSVDAAEVDRIVEEVTEARPERLARQAERRFGRDVALHLFRVASGLDSEIVGEGEILRQVKEAADRSRRHGGLSGELGLLARNAIAAGKRIREATGLAEGALSIGSLAAKAAEAQLGELTHVAALVIGAGQVAELVLQHLRSRGLHDIRVVSRELQHAEQLAQSFGARAIPWQEVDEALQSVDLVLSATSAPHLILDARRLQYLAQKRRGRPLLLLDLAQPRDIDPRVQEIRGMTCVDLAELHRRAEEHRKAREAEIRQAEALVQEAAEAFLRDLAARQAAPLIRAMSARAEGYLQEEMARLFRKGSFTPEQERLIGLFAHRLVHKLLNDPTLGLREEAEREGSGALEVARRLLRLPQVDAGTWEGGRL